MKIINLFIISVFILILSPKPLLAQQEQDIVSNQFITVVNPVRISVYSPDPKASLVAQYLEVQKRGLAATWLLNYDVTSDLGIVNVAKGMDTSQELGFFFEVTPKFASAAGIVYNKTDSWHRANSVFLSGYTQKDRIQLIDEAFRKFKENFGYYPVSVGAWWIDSFSLDYMQKKYGVTSNLNCADQFSTDGYEIWGQFWSVPFYPNKLHAGIPASSLGSKLDIVTIQWAARDPLNGYGRAGASLFSVQDRFEIEYFKKLVDLYAKSNNNGFGQMTVGLEGDFPPQSYSGFFASQLEVVKEGKQKKDLNVVTMKDFSKWYKDHFPDLSPTQVIKSKDLLGKEKLAIWYNSPKYRINIIYDYNTKETSIRDFRTYHDNFQEPYYISPNRDLNLAINIPSIIDSASNPEEEWKIFTDELDKVDHNGEVFILNFKDSAQIKLSNDGIKIFAKNIKVPNLIINAPLLSVKKNSKELDIEIKPNWNYPPKGLIFRDLTQEGTFFLKQRKVVISAILGSIVLGILLFIFHRKIKSHIYRISIIGLLLLLIGGHGYKWYLSNSKLYFVNQSELDALNRLKVLEGKRIVVMDRVCLQCVWHTPLMPAIFANKRNYVKKVTGKEVVYNSSIFNAKTRPEAKKELDKLNADYLYVVRFENYIEQAPFSPGDLNIEEIYSNANTQIWKVKKN